MSFASEPVTRRAQRTKCERFQFGSWNDGATLTNPILSGNSHLIPYSSSRLPAAIESTRSLYFAWIRASKYSIAGPPMSHAVQPFKRTSTANKNADDDDARPYVIVEDIGKGSFATVYKGYHEVHPFKAHGCDIQLTHARKHGTKSQSKLLNAIILPPNSSRICRVRFRFSNPSLIDISPS